VSTPVPSAPSSPASPSSSSAELPAARVLAQVDNVRGQRHVRLPARFARAAALRFLKMYRVEGDVVEGPVDATAVGRALGASQWALRVRDWRVRLPIPVTATRVGDGLVFAFDKHVIVVATDVAVRDLLYCLEAVKPEELAPDGRPIPWVPEGQASALAAARDDDDAVLLAAHEAPPPTPPASAAEADDAHLSSAAIRARFAEVVQRLGLPPIALSLRRGDAPRHGLVTGRVWYRADHVPLRVHLDTCPNADWAEVLATIVHELAHPLSRARGHDEAFKRGAVAIGERLFGEATFAGARARIDRSYHVVDMWLASGIRQSLRGGEPPSAKDVEGGDDGQLARILTKIKKLRELAHDQVGRPEGIAATATANDLITTYGLESYSVRIDDEIDDQMVDRWVVFEDGAVWRRLLAHAVAGYCDVFSLAVPAKARMHFFGRREDVIAAEYIYSVSAARIERDCADHLRRWKARRGKTTSAETVREKTSFCDCAALEFRKKLVVIGAEEAGRKPDRRADDEEATTPGLEAAEAFARAEHAKRGSSWSKGGGKTYRENAAGRAAGAAMEVVRGVGSSGGAAPLGLPRRGT